jgi:hypothetical protein
MELLAPVLYALFLLAFVLLLLLKAKNIKD